MKNDSKQVMDLDSVAEFMATTAGAVDDIVLNNEDFLEKNKILDHQILALGQLLYAVSETLLSMKAGAEVDGDE